MNLSSRRIIIRVRSRAGLQFQWFDDRLNQFETFFCKIRFSRPDQPGAGGSNYKSESEKKDE